MAKLSVVKGATSVIMRVFIQDSTSTVGAGKTGLVYNSAGLVLYRMRDDDGAAGATAITLATMTRGTWASGGFVEKDATNAPGWYEIGIPNAALASGSRSVSFHLKGATGMADLPFEIELTGVDNQDAVRGGMTALPNAAAQAAGGLFTRGTGAGQINQNANGQIDVNVVHNAGAAITASAGRQEVNVSHFGGAAGTFTSGRPEVRTVFIATDAMNAAALATDAVTELVTAIWAATTRVLTAGTNIVLAKGTGVTGFNDLSAAQVNAECDTALADVGLTTTITGRIDASITSRASSTDLGVVAGYIDTEVAAIKSKTDNLPSSPASAGDVAAVAAYVDTEVAAIKAVTDKLNTMVEVDGANYKFTMAALDYVQGHVGDAIDNAGLGGVGGNVAELFGLLEYDSGLERWVFDPAAFDNVALAGLDAAGVRAAVGLSSANLDTQLSGLATSSALSTLTGYVDTEVAAIKAKTDNLPATPASQGDVTAVAAYVDTEVAAIKAVTDKLDTALELDGAVYRLTTNALEQAPAPLTAAGVRSAVGLASANLDTQLAQLPAIETDTQDIQSRLPAALVSGRINASVGAVANDAITAAAIASDAGTEIGTAVWAATTRTLSSGANIVLAKGTGVTGFNDLSAAQVNAECDTALSDVGVTTTITGRIDAAISSRASSAALGTPAGISIAADIAAVKSDTGGIATVSSNVSAVKAKTDTLPSDPADQSLIIAATDALASTLSTINGKVDVVDGVVDAVKAKTDNLPSIPASQGDVNAVAVYVDTEVAAIKTVTDKLDTALELDSTVYRFTANALGQAPAPLSAAGVRSAVGLASANLDTQLGGLATASNLATVAGYIDTEVAAIKAKTDNLPTTPASQGDVAAVAAYVDTEVAAIKAKTDNLPASPAAVGDIPTLAAIADAVLDEAVEGSITLRQSIRLANAANGGKATGMDTTTGKLRDLGDTKDRVTATLDGVGNRTAVTLDLA